MTLNLVGDFCAPRVSCARPIPSGWGSNALASWHAWIIGTQIQAMCLVSYRVECNSFNHETEYPGVRCCSFGAASVYRGEDNMDSSYYTQGR